MLVIDKKQMGPVYVRTCLDMPLRSLYTFLFFLIVIPIALLGNSRAQIVFLIHIIVLLDHQNIIHTPSYTVGTSVHNVKSWPFAMWQIHASHVEA